MLPFHMATTGYKWGTYVPSSHRPHYSTVSSPAIVIHLPFWTSRHLLSLLLMLRDLLSWEQARPATSHPMGRTSHPIGRTRKSWNDPLQHWPLLGMESSQRPPLTLKSSPHRVYVSRARVSTFFSMKSKRVNILALQVTWYASTAQVCHYIPKVAINSMKWTSMNVFQ